MEYLYEQKLIWPWDFFPKYFPSYTDASFYKHAYKYYLKLIIDTIYIDKI